MKKIYKIQATRKTLIRWAYLEFGIKNAARMLDSGIAFNFFGANKSFFKTKKSAYHLAERIEMMGAFVAGRLGKNDIENVRVVEA